MLLTTGHQIVRTRSVRAFQEYIVRGISCCFKLPGRGHGMTLVLDELQQLQPKTLSDPELGTGKHVRCIDSLQSSHRSGLAGDSVRVFDAIAGLNHWNRSRSLAKIGSSWCLRAMLC